MLLSNHEQLLRLFYCLGFGALLYAYSALFRLWQILTKARALGRFVSDVLLCVSGGVLFFLFNLAVSGGQLRAAMLLAVALGFATAHLTVRPIGHLLMPLVSAARRIGGFMRKKGHNFLKNVGIFFKKGLHCIHKVVYNESTNNIDYKRVRFTRLFTAVPRPHDTPPSLSPLRKGCFFMKSTLKNKQSVFFRIALAALLVWVIVSLLQLQIEIKDKRHDLADLNAQIVAQERLNEDLENDSANEDLYLEQQARNKGLAKPGEIIFKEVPGN